MRWLAALLLVLLPGIAEATFPAVVGTPTQTADSADTTTHAINYPSSMTNGNLVILYASCRNSNASATWDAAVTPLFNTTPSSGTSRSRYTAAYRTVDGSEGATITLTTSIANSCAAIAYEISGVHASQVPTCTTALQDVANSNPDPPEHTASWGSDDNLWIIGYSVSSTRTTSVTPTNYGNTVTVSSTSGVDTTIASSRRADTALSVDNPGTYTIGGGTERWATSTCAIRPAAAASAGAIIGGGLCASGLCH
jgi:hypothetical protein